MELVPAVLASGWASGVNAYLCVVVLGVLGRFGGVVLAASGGAAAHASELASSPGAAAGGVSRRTPRPRRRGPGRRA